MAATPQFPTDSKVSSFVRMDLVDPEFHPALWNSSTFPTTMPKATVHEDHNPVLGEVKIWRAWYVLWVRNPSSDSLLLKGIGNSHLGRFITSRCHPGHSLRAFVHRQRVGHCFAPSSRASGVEIDFASPGGTAFPIWRMTLDRVPLKKWSSGKPWIRAISRRV